MADSTPVRDRSDRVRSMISIDDVDPDRDVVGVRWEMVMRARDRAVDDTMDTSEALRQVADRLADELNKMQVEIDSHRHAG